MKTPIHIISLLLILGLTTACSEFISPNVEDFSLEVLAPADSLYTAESELSFWWEATDSAEAYRFQLASPSFSSPTEVFDSLLTDNLVGFSLVEGRYEWRVRVENAASSSEYQTRQLTVDQTSPNAPEIGYPGSGMLLAKGRDSLEVRWEHADVPLDGQAALVRDSLRLLGPSGELLGRWVPEQIASLRWEIADIIPGIDPGDTLSFQIWAWSTDPAGNRSEGDSVSFFITHP